MSKSELTILRRKAGADRPPPEYGVMTPAKGLRLALARAGDDVLGVAAVAGAVEECRATIPQLPDFLSDGALAVLLEGRDGARGMAVLDAGALAAVIEALTTGHVSQGEVGPTPRRPTGTDAFLCARFVSQVLKGLADNLAALPEAAWARGFSSGEQIKDVRSLPLILPDVAYRSIAAPVDFAGGMRSGTVRLVLPWAGPTALPKPPSVPEAAASGERAGEPDAQEAAEAARAELLKGEVVLDAVLHRVRVPLSRLMTWRVGDQVPFPVHAIASVTLVDAAGEPVARGRLGQSRGNRALKIMSEATRHDAELDPLTVSAAGGTSVGLANLDAPKTPGAPEADPDPPGADLPDLGEIDDLPPLDAAMGDLPELPDLPDLPSVID